MSRKLEGQPIAESPPLHRLMELRVLLEKVWPLDQKFRYQIDKSVRAATSAVSQEDSLSFKANPHDFAKVGCGGGGGARIRKGWSNDVVCAVQESGSDDDSNRQDGRLSPSQPNIYVPPKVMAVPYGKSLHGVQ